MKTAPTRDCWWTIRLLCPLKNPKKSFCDHEQNDGVFSSLPFQVLFPALIHFWSQRDPLWSVRHTFSRCQAFIYSHRATICPSRWAHMCTVAYARGCRLFSQQLWRISRGQVSSNETRQLNCSLVLFLVCKIDAPIWNDFVLVTIEGFAANIRILWFDVCFSRV